MTAYVKQTYGRLLFTAPSENVILFAEAHGHFYSEIPVYTFALAQGLIFHKRDRYRQGLGSRALLLWNR